MHRKLLAFNNRIKQTCFLDEFVEQSLSTHKGGWCVEFCHPTMVEHHDTIGIEDGVDPMSNSDDGAILERVAAQRALQQSVRLNVNGSLCSR